ncbi:WAP four-disulfide core domain protein 3-like [Pollicipes pollicipes]|uniref:WAP four-disulfide core domain protein 3-like n=1 Tax=Pollicipes pollicipes TaxID=41117 RepID=UPI00188535DC|nr:WAP four-disulfide core domain protein 3-like [Pollicipes pollicipes]
MRASVLTIVCLLALAGVCSASHPPTKPGKCISRAFIALACEPHEIKKLCRTDFDCKGDHKCCRVQRCVTACERPAGPNPGRCPPPSAVPNTGSNIHYCTVDTDCGLVRKCCLNIRGVRRCAPPRSAGLKGCPPNKGIITTCEYIEGIHCTTQKDCAKGEICCPYGCGSRCFPSYKG